jgi:hypothetical protein
MGHAVILILVGLFSVRRFLNSLIKLSKTARELGGEWLEWRQLLASIKTPSQKS